MKYRLFGNSGLRVSELALGTMTFGTEVPYGVDYVQSKAIFDTYANAGGNFLDTANLYTFGTSEKFLGAFTASDRDHFVIATKYTLRDREGDPNFSGNHRKNLVRSVRESLKRLQTDFLDILWLHAWDSTTREEEVMRGLDDLVAQGLVQYIAISDTPAWVVARSNTIAELRGWHRFAGLQVEYSLLQRTAERDLFPMAHAFDLAITPWGAIGGGALTGKYLRGESGRVPEHSIRRNARSQAIAETVVAIAQEIGVPPSQVALQWTRQNASVQKNVVLPIIGAKSTEQLQESLGVITLTLTDDHLQRLDAVSVIELGFPHDFLRGEGVQDVMFGKTQQKIVSHR
jgi:aryl-alcohol dehydrogenase-like predicted oxidoreductase